MGQWAPSAKFFTSWLKPLITPLITGHMKCGISLAGR